MSFATIFQAEFHNLIKQFYKGGLKFCIMKNIVSSNKGDVKLLTIVSSIIALIHICVSIGFNKYFYHLSQHDY